MYGEAPQEEIREGLKGRDSTREDWKRLEMEGKRREGRAVLKNGRKGRQG